MTPIGRGHDSIRPVGRAPSTAGSSVVWDQTSLQREQEAKRREVSPVPRTPQQRLYDAKKVTCRKVFWFVCSANEDCGGEVLIVADDVTKAERLVRDQGWSVLKDLGWTCKACSLVYHHPKGNVGPRRKRRKYTTAQTTNQMRLKRKPPL